MKAGWLVVVLVCLVAIASASTIRLHFAYDLFNDTKLINSTNNYSEYTTSLTAPKFVVDGFKLRGEDFILAGQDFFVTYTDNETKQSITVFELNALVNSRVNARTMSLQDLLNQTNIQLESQKNETAVAKAQSFPALADALQLVALVVGLIILAYFAISFFSKYRDKNSPNYSMQWKPEMEKNTTYEDELQDAFARVEQGGRGYD